MTRFPSPPAEPEITREQDAMALEVARARLIVVHMKAALKLMDNHTDLGALIEDCAARIEVAADRIEADNRLPVDVRMMRALGDVILGTE